MSSQSSDETTSPEVGEGIALALRARESGDGRAFVAWLARHPEHAETVARFVADDRAIGAVVAPLRPSYSDLAGAILGGFEVSELIGRGGSGDVFLARDPRLNRDVALKVIRTGEASPAELARFRFEAATVAALDHPNIVPVLSFDEDAPTPYLVMPLMTGGSLEAWLKGRGANRCLPEKEAAGLVRDIARGVHHAHQRGLIHRDLKPGNVLLDRDNTPHVADFGLARPFDASVSTGGIAGTFAYMAPEQARGDKGLTTAVDVHALGAILFELLTGRTPFGGGSAAVLPRVIADPAPPVRQFRPDVSRDLEAVCLKCLEKQPAARYASAREVAHDLDRFLRGEAVRARPPGFWDWLRQLARTRPEPHPHYSWPVVAWFGAIILATNAAVYALVRGDAPALGVWAANAVSTGAMGLVLWWYMLRRFRQLPVTERHSLIIAAGLILAYLPLMAAYVPVSLSAPARAGLGLYPPLAALSGVGLFTLGSTNWSRFFPVGLAVMALTPLLARWPEESPLVYGGATAAVMWFWAWAKRDGFGYRPADPPRD